MCLGELDEGGGDAERFGVSGCFLAALKLIAFRLTNDQVRYISDLSAELINTLLEEAM